MESDCGRHQDAAAYVLGDLRGRALLDYRRHLQGCPQCQDDVDLLQSAADAIPLMASAPPEGADAEPDEPESIRPGVWARERIETVTAPKPPTLARQLARPSQRRGGNRAGGWWQQQVTRPAAAGVVGLAVLALVVIILTKQGQSINYVHAESAWRNGAAVLKMDGSEGQLLVVGMPKAPSGETYQVWAVEPGVEKEVPLDVNLLLNKQGEGGVIIPGDVHAYEALVVYAEPNAGSKSPQGTPYVVADLRKVNQK